MNYMKIIINEDMKNAYYDLALEGFINSGLNNRYLVQPEEIKKNLPFWKLKLSGTQINIIYNVSNEGEISMGNLAKTQAVAKNVISTPVNKLIAMNILHRYQKPDNYRFVYVALTDYGKGILKEQRDVLSDCLMKKFYSVASKDDLVKLTDCYRIINEVLLRFERLEKSKAE